jgi:hypothetical protein
VDYDLLGDAAKRAPQRSRRNRRVRSGAAAATVLQGLCRQHRFVVCERRRLCGFRWRLSADQAEALAEKLSTGTSTHDYQLFAATAKELGLPVNTAIPDDVLDLMKLYPHPVRAQSGGGGGEYLPIPRQKEAVSREA